MHSIDKLNAHIPYNSLRIDFTNQIIDRKSDFLKLQELKFPDFFENKKESLKIKKAKNIPKIVETNKSSSNEYETFVDPKNDPLRMTPISVKRKLQTVSCPASPTTNTLTPKTIYYDVLYLKPGSSGLTSIDSNNFF